MSDIKLTTLDNGVRVLTDYVPSVESAALGIWAGVGTRNEELSNNGAAHMVEHMLFKGTQKRDAAKIAEEIENVGGSMNAYTSRELTSYHIHLLKDDAPLALDVLADMYRGSSFPDEEIERERGVILQEIGMCNDTPDDVIFDLHFETSYPDQAFGAPILGREHNIKEMSREALQGYAQRFYQGHNTVISASGNIEHDAFVEQVRTLFADMPSGEKAPTQRAHYQGGEIRQEKDLEQSHFILSFEGLARLDEDYYTAQALSTILGAGMSSRLFQEVREKRGLVYSIFSYHSGYQDAGQFGIYAGTGPEKMGEIMPVICDEVLKLGSSITQEELVRAKAQLKASLLMSRESMMRRADQNAKGLIFRDQIFEQEALAAKIDAVDLKDLEDVAAKIFATKPTLSALGPLSELESYDKLEQRLAA